MFTVTSRVRSTEQSKQNAGPIENCETSGLQFSTEHELHPKSNINAPMNESQAVEFAIQWSIRASVILVYGRLIYRLWRGTPAQTTQRIQEYYIWLTGFLLFSLHVCLSFHFVHHWAHSDAWNRTATETENLIGIRSGDGIWANYLMLALWGMDLLRLYKAKRIGGIPSLSVDRAIAFFFGFMFINATVVFCPIGYRYLACPALILAIYVWRVQKI